MDVLTLDIGGNFIKYAMIDEQLKMHGKGKIPTPNDTLENLFLAIDDIFQKFHAPVQKTCRHCSTISCHTTIRLFPHAASTKYKHR